MFPQSADLDENGSTSGSCKLKGFDMTLSNEVEGNGHKERIYHVLADSDKPNILIIKVRHLAVDADGSPRAYHPLDAYGVCAPGPDGPCALDDLHGSASVSVCAHPESSNKATCYKASQFATKFAELWPSIQGKTPTSTEGEYYRYESDDKKYLTTFKNNIIPQSSSDQSPCTQTSGYFLSVSSLSKKGGYTTSGTSVGCAYITPNAEEIPFLVIPRRAFADNHLGSINVGDLALVQYRNRRVYAVVGDKGPMENFGEGSIGLSQSLHGTTIAIKQRTELESKLDISDSPVTVLILGGSRDVLKQKFDLAHIAGAGDQLFKDWLTGDDKSRFASCLSQARGNAN